MSFAFLAGHLSVCFPLWRDPRPVKRASSGPARPAVSMAAVVASYGRWRYCLAGLFCRVRRRQCPGKCQS